MLNQVADPNSIHIDSMFGLTTIRRNPVSSISPFIRERLSIERKHEFFIIDPGEQSKPNLLDHLRDLLRVKTHQSLKSPVCSCGPLPGSAPGARIASDFPLNPGDNPGHRRRSPGEHREKRLILNQWAPALLGLAIWTPCTLLLSTMV